MGEEEREALGDGRYDMSERLVAINIARKQIKGF